MTGRLVRVSFVGLVLDLLGRHVKRTALLMRRNQTCLSWGNGERESKRAKSVRAVWQAPYVRLIDQSLRAHTASQMAGSSYQKANRYSHIICCLAPPQRGSIPILCKALREHVQPRTKISPPRLWSQCTQSFHPYISQSR